MINVIVLSCYCHIIMLPCCRVAVLSCHHTASLQGLQSRLGPAVDIILSPADDKKNAQSMTELLDRCEEESGMGATLALGILDTVWSLPAPVRPQIGEWVISAVYEALRRYGVFSR